MRYSRSKMGSYLFLLVLCFYQNPQIKKQIPASEPMVSADSIEWVQGTGLAYLNHQQFSGQVITTYPNGSLASAISYAKGKREGWSRKWFDDGTLSFESQYLNGKKDGVTTTWWRNKNIRSRSRHIAGIAHGMQEQWYISGARFKRIQLINGKEEGLQQSWRENGKLYNNYEAIDGRIFGLKRANLCFQLDEEIIQYEN